MSTTRIAVQDRRMPMGSMTRTLLHSEGCPQSGVVSCPMWPVLMLIYSGLSLGATGRPTVERKGSRDAGD